jgi:hypothetical protein
MALPFWTPIMEMLPDGGIYDPESGLSYVGPGARLPGGQDPDTFIVPTSPTAATVAQANEMLRGTGLTAPITGEGSNTSAIGTENPTRTNTFVSGRTEPVYQATDGKEFTSKTEYITHQNKLNNPSNPSPNPNTIVLPEGIVPSTITQGDPFAAQTQREAVNARAIFASIFQQYFNRPGDDRFVTDLTKFVEDSISKGYTADTISALLPQTEAYKERFKGNKGRLEAGLAAYSPGEYLQAEDTYAEILNRFNLGGLATRDQFADLISNRKSASEVADLVQNVYFRIQNADSVLRQQLNTLKIGAGLTDADLAQALLSGKEGAQTLKQKIAGAEVGAEAATRGLSAIRAQNLANLGVTREQARTGFEAIRQTQPTFEKLSDIYNRPAAPATPEARAARTESVQEELEREQFQGLRSEERARLAQQEQAAFMGSSGTQGIGLRRRSQRGLI